MKLINDKQLAINTNNELSVVSISSIMYVMKVKNSKTITINTTFGEIICTSSLYNIYNLLGEQFVKVHQSIVVNLSFIKTIEKSSAKLTLINGENIYISRKYITELLNLWDFKN